MLMSIKRPIGETMGDPPKDSRFSFDENYNKLEGSWNLLHIARYGGVSIGIVISLALIKDIQKTLWWLLAYIYAYNGRHDDDYSDLEGCGRKTLAICIALVDLLIVLLCSVTQGLNYFY